MTTIFIGVNSQQVEPLEQSVLPTATTILTLWPMNLWICLLAAVILTALFFFISYILRCIYRRRLNERMNHHLGRFAPRIPVAIRAPKRNRSSCDVYAIPTAPTQSLPSYYYLYLNSQTRSTDKHSRSCYDDKQFMMDC